MTSKVLRWGNSLGVRIPAEHARKLGLEDGSAIEIRLESGRIVIEPVPVVPTVEELLSRIRAHNRHDDLHWWPPGYGGSET
jgi:antitoxin MazE